MATQKEMFERIMAVMEDDAEIVAFCKKKIEQLDRKKPYFNPEAEEFAKAVATYLSEDESPKTCAEIGEAMGCSTNKAAAAVKRLLKDEIIIEIEPSKKSGRKTYVIA